MKTYTKKIPIFPINITKKEKTLFQKQLKLAKKIKPTETEQEVIKRVEKEMRIKKWIS